MGGLLRQRTRGVLLAGDLTMVILFVVIGQADHDLIDPVNPVWGVLQSTLVFAAPWALTGAWLGAFPSGGEYAARPMLARALNAWLVTTLLGLLLRSAVLGRAVLPTIFVWATLGFGVAMVLGWRLVFAGLWWWSGRPRRPGANA